MKALVWTGLNKVKLKDIEDPVPAEDEALIKVASAGICGTDLHILEGRHPRGKNPPIVLGHEIAGEIIELKKSEDNRIQIGDKVVVEPLIPCGHCYACMKGNREVCENLNLYGVDVQGGFAEYVVVKRKAIHKIPDNLSMIVAGLAEPTAVAVHAIRRSNYKIGDSVCVLGGGPIGSLIALILHLHGCADIVVIEPRKFRRDIIKSLGIKVIDPENKRALQNRKSSFHTIFDTAGAQSSVDTACTVCKQHGNIVLLALPGETLEWSHIKIVFKEIELIGSRVYATFDFSRAISILNTYSERFEKIIHPIFQLEDGEKAFKFAKDGTQSMRVMFRV